MSIPDWLVQSVVSVALAAWCTVVVGLLGWTLYEVNDQGKKIATMDARIDMLTQFVIPAQRRAEVGR